MSDPYIKDRKVISAARNLITEYEPLLNAVLEQLSRETDAEKVTGDDAFTIAKQTIHKEARKDAFRDFISRIRTYGSQRLE